ncbi:MAG: Bcr/CflA family drug resistance efflux transporter [Chloroflexi bacterium]|nr:MAG: Bcr/CflA family drug resistance efflux transporter [Chloroflexota bacterium]
MTTSPRGAVYAKLALTLGILTAFAPFSIDMYLPGLPAIAQEFNTDTAAVQQTLAVFFLGLSLGQVFYGPISDRLGRRRPLLFGCLLYSAACIGCALAPSLGSLVALRFAQALGGCAGVVIARSVVRDLFDQTESARMYSLLMLVLGVAPITAPLIGGQLLLFFGWRSIFVALFGFGVLCLLLVFFVLPETLPAERRARTGLSVALRTYGSLLIDGRYMGYALAGGLASAGMFAYIAGSPFVFIELNGVAPEHFGLIFGTNAIGLITASQINRWLLGYYTSGQILTAALAFTAGASLLLAGVAATGIGGFVALLVVLFFTIASTGFVGPNSTAAAMAPYGSRAGSAAALLGSVQFACGAAAGALVGVLHNGTALPMAGTIALCGVSAFLVLQFLALRRQPQPAPSPEST